jgi:hypothetical protein
LRYLTPRLCTPSLLWAAFYFLCVLFHSLLLGFDCCSDESISFHYVKEKLLYKLYNYVYHCDNKLTN